MSKSKLEAIRDQRALDIIEAKAAVPVESLVQKLADGPFAQRKPLCLRERLETLLKNGETCLAAEFKRASPSKGDIASSASIRADDVAMLYADGGASVMSVLTEPKWFKGSLEDMNAARDALDVRQTKMTEAGQAVLRPLVLRKDFLIDEYQIHEARAYGADTLLLIVAILKDELLASLIKCARSLGMEPLVEVNNEVELESALAAGARVIGVNNRNLHTFQLDMTTTSRLADLLRSRGLLLEASNVENPGSGTVVLAALSGISSRADVEKYREEGVNCVLVGESLMRSVDPVKAMRVLRGVTQEQKVRVKICGNTNVEDSVAACQAGADFIGIIFAESPRQVSVETAKAIVKVVRGFGERTERMELKIDDAQVSGTDKKAKLDADGAHAQWFGKWRKTLDTACDRCPLVVGVFMNQDMEEVKKIALDVGLDMVQLHGNEGFEVATEEHCGVPAFRVVHVLVGEDGAASSDLRAKNTLAEIKSGLACGVLLDTKVKGLLGGTGTTFDWDVAAAVGAAGVPVMVAGGLTAENIKEAVQKTSPWVVDVSSGVEESPGKKDHAKIQAFVQGARS